MPARLAMTHDTRSSCGRHTRPRRRVLGLLAIALLLVSCSRGDRQSTNGGGGANAEPALELLFTYGSEKQNWIDESTAAFNGQRRKTASGKVIRVKPMPMGSGESIEEILAGRIQAHLTSPASAAFIKLGNADSRVKTGKDLVGATQNLVLSPVAIAMWKPMAEALGWGQRPIGWADVVALARRPEGWGSVGHPEWGRFRFGHTHPQASNSGLIALLAETYAGAGKIGGLTLEDVRKPATMHFVEGVEQSVVHYGSSTGFFGRKMFANGPGYLSAAVLYENMVIESSDPANKLPMPIVAIYPKEGTFWSDHPAAIVEREWVTPEHRAAAQDYIAFLLERKQQERAIAFGFRPADPSIALAAPIDAAHGVNPREPQTTLEVPDPTIVNAILDVWRQVKRNARVVLAVDVSGSMNDENKIGAARDGAQAFVSALGDRDELGLMTFNDKVAWAVPLAPVGSSRDRLGTVIKGLFADGGTSLYDAVDRAYASLAATPEPSRISAIVVLSDGADRNSAMGLDTLLSHVKFDNEGRTIRIFTIGYGSDARAEQLRAIADATQGRYYEGKPGNIREVFKEISTFF
jgi:Ca-activated chloride channel family protein